MIRSSLALVFGIGTLWSTMAIGAPLELKFGMFISPNGFQIKQVFEPWIQQMHEQVGNEIHVKIYPGGILGRDPVQQLTLVRSGVQDLTLAIPSYTPARFTDLSLLQLPGLVRTSTEGSLAVWRMFQMGMIRGFEDVKVVGLFTLDAFGLHTAKPMASHRDVRGMKLRSGGRVHNDIATVLGAVPVGMSITRIAENISRNQIDGAIIPWTALIPFRINQVAHYHYSADLGVLPVVVAMNKSRYEGLSPSAKAALDRSGPLLSEMNGKTYDETGMDYMRRHKGDRRHTVIEPSAAQREEMQALFRPLHDQWKAQFGIERYRTLVQILAEIRKGNR